MLLLPGAHWGCTQTEGAGTEPWGTEPQRQMDTSRGYSYYNSKLLILVTTTTTCFLVNKKDPRQTLNTWGGDALWQFREGYIYRPGQSGGWEAADKKSDFSCLSL